MTPNFTRPSSSGSSVSAKYGSSQPIKLHRKWSYMESMTLGRRASSSALTHTRQVSGSCLRDRRKESFQIDHNSSEIKQASLKPKPCVVVLRMVAELPPSHIYVWECCMQLEGCGAQ